jgi:hypothetical protein
MSHLGLVIELLGQEFAKSNPVKLSHYEFVHEITQQSAYIRGQLLLISL